MATVWLQFGNIKTILEMDGGNDRTTMSTLMPLSCSFKSDEDTGGRDSSLPALPET